MRADSKMEASRRLPADWESERAIFADYSCSTLEQPRAP